MIWWQVALVLVGAYLLGSFPSAYLAGKLKSGVDIRTIGSKNMGTMNSVYSLGFGWGLAVLLCDLAKGAIPVLVARWLGMTDIIQFLAGLIAILGHNFPIFLKFKGGKGGATAIGATSAFIPWIWVISFPIFLLIMLIIKVPTISYGIAMVSFPIIGAIMYKGTNIWWFTLVYILIPYLWYIPRLIEMRKKGGSWKHVFIRKSVKDRF